MIPDVDLEALKRLEKEATPGEWHVQAATEGDWEHGVHHYVEGIVSDSVEGRPWVIRFDDDYGTDQNADACLIAELRNQFPAIVAEITELRAALERGQRIEAAARLGWDALIWCSGSNDFQVDGIARQGWLKVAVPALDALRAALAPAPAEEDRP